MIRPSGTATDDAIVGGARHGGITSIPGAPGVTTESCRARRFPAISAPWVTMSETSETASEFSRRDD
jgi:hypothetical protein